MKIIACLKVIADPDIVEFDLAANMLAKLHPVLDPVGYQVLEEALRLKEQHGGQVTVLSVAPRDKAGIIGSALLAGADRALRAWHDSLVQADAWMTAAALGGCLENLDFDLVLCGAGSGDSGSQVMALALADILRLPAVAGVIGLETDNHGGLTVHKKFSRGARETYRLKAPAVLGLEPGINRPRYVPLFSKTYRRGQLKQVEKIELKLGSLPQERRTSVVRYTQSKPRVKAGVNVTALSMADRMKMIRGELGSKKEVFSGAPDTGAMKIMNELEPHLK